LNPAENYILSQPELYKEILLYLQLMVERTVPELELKYKYKIPFYYLYGKPFCYFNASHKKKIVDVGFVQGVFLEANFPELFDGDNRKQVRSIQVADIEIFDELMFRNLLRAAATYLDKSKRAWDP